MDNIHNQVTVPMNKSTVNGVSDTDTTNDVNPTDVMAKMETLMNQLKMIFKELRNLMQKFAAKQEELANKINNSSMTATRKAIEKTFEAGMAQALVQIGSSLVGIASSALGDETGHLSQSMSKSMEAGGSAYTAGLTKDASLEKMVADNMQRNAAHFKEGKIEQLAKDLSDKLLSVYKLITDVNKSLTSAVRY